MRLCRLPALLVLAGLPLVMSAAAAVAQSAPAQTVAVSDVRTACKADMDKLCPGAERGDDGLHRGRVVDDEQEIDLAGRRVALGVRVGIGTTAVGVERASVRGGVAPVGTSSLKRRATAVHGGQGAGEERKKSKRTQQAHETSGGQKWSVKRARGGDGLPADIRLSNRRTRAPPPAEPQEYRRFHEPVPWWPTTLRSDVGATRQLHGQRTNHGSPRTLPFR